MLIQWNLSRADTLGTRKGVRNWTHSIGMVLFTDSELRTTFFKLSIQYHQEVLPILNNC